MWGEASRLRPSHTTVRAGPHMAVLRVELSSAEQLGNPERREVTLGRANASPCELARCHRP